MSYPYACRIDVKFPTSRQAEQTMQVLQVDREPGDRVIKAFSIVNMETDKGSDNQKTVVMRV